MNNNFEINSSIIEDGLELDNNLDANTVEELNTRTNLIEESQASDIFDDVEEHRDIIKGDIKKNKDKQYYLDKAERKRKRQLIREERQKRSSASVMLPNTIYDNGGVFDKKDLDEGVVYPLHMRKFYTVMTFLKTKICLAITGCILIFLVIIITTVSLSSKSKSKKAANQITYPQTVTPVPPPVLVIPPRYSNIPPRRAVTPPKVLPVVLRPPRGK